MSRTPETCSKVTCFRQAAVIMHSADGKVQRAACASTDHHRHVMLRMMDEGLGPVTPRATAWKRQLQEGARS